jgi:hypothetical protein
MGLQRNAVTDIFREVEEDLKRDQALELWKKYGKYIMVFAVAVVVMTGAIVAWQNYRESQRGADGRAFARALELVNKGDLGAASAAMNDIAAGGGGYHALAVLQQAGLRIKAGDQAGAAAIYDKLAADGDASPAFRDLAVVLWGLASIDRADPATIDKKLQPLTAAGAPFRPSALELVGLVALKTGDLKMARQTFQALADDTTAPAGLRQRATQILTWIGEQGGA